MDRAPGGPLTGGPERRYGRLFWPLAVIGWAVIAVGVAGALRNGARTVPPALARWLVGSAVVHDALIAPLVFGTGLLLARLVPARIRPFLQAGLLVTGMLALATFPFVGGFGRRPDNPSALPGNYALGLLGVTGVVWLVVALLAARRLAVRRRR